MDLYIFFKISSATLVIFWGEVYDIVLIIVSSYLHFTNDESVLSVWGACLLSKRNVL